MLQEQRECFDLQQKPMMLLNVFVLVLAKSLGNFTSKLAGACPVALAVLMLDAW